MLSGRASLPDAQEPNPVKPKIGESVEFRIRNIIQRRLAAKLFGQLGQPNASVDLVEGGIEKTAHTGLYRSRLLAGF